MATGGGRGWARLSLIACLAMAVPALAVPATPVYAAVGDLVVVDDVATTGTDQSVTVPVLANDGGSPLVLTGTTVPAHGTTTVNSDGTITYTPAVGYAGADAFTYDVEDGDGDTGTGTVSVTVANEPPVAVADEIATATSQPVTISVLANDSDRNVGQTLTVASVSDSAALNPDGTVTATASFTYTVSDGAGGTAAAAVSVLVAGEAPVAADDFATTAYDTAVTLDVRANDSAQAVIDPVTAPVDQDGNPCGAVTVEPDGRLVYDPPAEFSGVATFTYALEAGEPAVVTITVGDAAPSAVDDLVAVEPDPPTLIPVLDNDSDPNPGDELSVIGVSAAEHGAVVRDPDGALAYRPDPGYVGPDSFTYTISDGNRATDTATVTIRGPNGSPVAGDDTATVRPGDTVVVRVLDNDTDPDGDPLTVTGIVAGDGGEPVANPDGTVTYTPRAMFNGTDTFTYTVDDGYGATDQGRVTVSVVNQAPVAPDARITTPAGDPTTVDLLDRVSDGDGDTVTLSAVSNPPHGTTVVNSDKSVTYRPDSGFAGADSFSYTVVDGLGGEASGTVTVSVTNAVPVAAPDTVDTAHRTTITIGVLANDSDRDRDTLSIGALTAPRDRAGTIRGTAEVLTNNTVAYHPPNGFSGRVTFSYQVLDGYGGRDTAVVTVNVANAPPSATDNAIRLDTARTVVINLLADDLDPNGGQLTIAAVSQPKHGTVAINTDGTVRYEPAPNFQGTDSFTYAVKDPAGGMDTGTVTLTVGGSGFTAVPVAGSDTAITVAGRPVSIKVLANDGDADGDVLTVTKVTEAAHGDIVLDTDGLITYVPEAGFVGTDKFTYTIDDGGGRTATATVTVAVAAEPIRSTASEVMTPVIRAGMVAFALGVLLIGVARESVRARRLAAPPSGT